MTQKRGDIKNKCVWNDEEPQPIAIPLPSYKFPHDADADKNDRSFVGRDNLIRELTTILDETSNTRGCYLITGFRGAGKTSLINKVLAIHAKESTHTPWLKLKEFKNRKSESKSIEDEIEGYPAQESKTPNQVDIELKTVESNSIQDGDSDSQHEDDVPVSRPKYKKPKMQGTPLRWLGLLRIKARLKLRCLVEDRILRTAKYLYLINIMWRWLYYIFKQVVGLVPSQKISPLIAVRVNLGHDQSLRPRNILFNTTSLMLKEIEKYSSRTFILRALMFVATVYVGAFLLGELVSALAGGWYEIKQYFHSGIPSISKYLSLAVLEGVFLLIVTVVVYFVWTRALHTYDRVYYRLRRLSERMAYTEEYHKGVSHSGLSLGRKQIMPPLDARQIEMELLDILEECRKIPQIFVRPNVVFVFDELDKIARNQESDKDNIFTNPTIDRDRLERKKKVDDLLSALKSFITHGKARFFFIAGREMLDSYQAERGSASSLYESLFNRILEVPSLLTDSSDHNLQRLHSLIEVYVCRNLMDADIAIYVWLLYTHRRVDINPFWKKDLLRKVKYSPFTLQNYYHYLNLVPNLEGVEARRIILGLRNFVQFLTLHSWGNPKRLTSLFEHFTKPVEEVDWRQKKDMLRIAGPMGQTKMALQFGIIDQQRIILASNIYTQLYHELGRRLANSGDKLVVSTLAALQYILKFHRYAFSRYHLERMSEALSVYRSPELNNVVDTLMNRVLVPYVRRIRNSHYRYRFNNDFEQEMRYISRVSDVESAAFNFSLDATADVKAHYNTLLSKVINTDDPDEKSSIVGVCGLSMVLGDLYSAEQSHDQAAAHYQKAVDAVEKHALADPVRYGVFFVEALLRLGETYERRQRYDRAAGVYILARRMVLNIADKQEGKKIPDPIGVGDSKWDVLRQPLWAYWFLQLKRSPLPGLATLESVTKDPDRPFGGPADTVHHYKTGQLAFFYGAHYLSTQSFIAAIQSIDFVNDLTERNVYIGAYAFLNLGENLIQAKLSKCSEEICGSHLKDEKNKKIEFGEVLTNFIEQVYKLLEPCTDISSLTQLEKRYIDKQVNGKYYFDVLSNIKDENDFVSKIDICCTLGMMVYAANLLNRNGLFYHASIAYMKIIAIWGMICDVLNLLTQMQCSKTWRVDGITCQQSSDVSSIMAKSEKWISELRILAADNITSLHAGGYSRFQNRWANRDVLPINIENEENVNNLGFRTIQDVSKDWLEYFKPKLERRNQHRHIKDFSTLEEFVGELPQAMRYLFDLDKNQDKKKFRKILNNIRESIFFQRSLVGQKLIHFSMWEYISKLRFITKLKPFAVRQQTLVPHSVRSLLFSHWLAGRRYLYWSVFDRLPDDSEKPLSHGQTKLLYDNAAKAVHDFYRAKYYIAQLSGSDQDIIFPSVSIVMYDLWYLLYLLVRYNVKVGNLEYQKAVEVVRSGLSASKLRRHDTPAALYNFENVRRRAMDGLLDSEHMRDVSNRARAEAIRTRYYLTDDFEDPRFHLDWTLIQMHGSISRVLRCYVELASDELKRTSEVARRAQ